MIIIKPNPIEHLTQSIGPLLDCLSTLLNQDPDFNWLSMNWAKTQPIERLGWSNIRGWSSISVKSSILGASFHNNLTFEWFHNVNIAFIVLSNCRSDIYLLIQRYFSFELAFLGLSLYVVWHLTSLPKLCAITIVCASFPSMAWAKIILCALKVIISTC